jgi:hypothetical protein
MLVQDLHRTAVRELDRARVPRSTAMKLTGHKTERICRRQAILSEAELAEGVQRWSAFPERVRRENPHSSRIVGGNEGGG